MSTQLADPRETPLPTEPIPDANAPDELLDSSVARRTAMEMAALTRVLFGVAGPLQTSSEPGPPPAEAPAPAPEQVAPPVVPQPSTPVVGIPFPQGIPVPQPEASPAPAPVVPTSLPLPEIPVDASEPARETQRRPVGPSLELLQEIAFLEE